MLTLKEDRFEGVIYAAIATVIFSTGAILVRLSASLAPIHITFARMLLASFFVLSFAFIIKENIRPRVEELKRLAPYGLITATHFYFFISSLYLTTIAHALSLCYTAPIFAALFSNFILKERLVFTKYIGIAIATLGIAILTGFEPRMSGSMWKGDFFALLSGVAMGLYSVVGRKERGYLPLLKYAFWVYFFAAIFLLPLALRASSSTITASNVIMVILMALFPTAIGHTLYNASLRKTLATYSNLISTQEVTGGVLLGYFILGERPSPTCLGGMLVALVGIAIVLSGNKRKNQIQMNK